MMRGLISSAWLPPWWFPALAVAAGGSSGPANTTRGRAVAGNNNAIATWIICLFMGRTPGERAPGLAQAKVTWSSRLRAAPQHRPYVHLILDMTLLYLI